MTRAPMKAWVSLSSSAPKKASESLTDSRVSSWMLRPAMVTASDSGLRRAPPQAEHGRSDMNCSTLSRTAWDIEVACWRRSCGMTPSNQPQLPPPLRRAARGTSARGARGPSQQQGAVALRELVPGHVERDVVLRRRSRPSSRS